MDLSSVCWHAYWLVSEYWHVSLCPHSIRVYNCLYLCVCVCVSAFWVPWVLPTNCLADTSGYTNKIAVHALHGTKEHGGFGVPLCAEPYGVEAQSSVMNLLADSDNDTSLALNNFTDHRPELTQKHLHTMNEFDCAVKTKKGTVWSVALADRASRIGYVPKTKPFECGADAEFIKKSTAKWHLGLRWRIKVFQAKQISRS